MKQFVKWKPILCKSVNKTDVYVDVIGELDVRNRGILLNQIMSMPQKEPISLSKAYRLMDIASEKAFKARQLGTEPGGYQWYETNFVFWISEQGYHIELTGDEFESYAISDKVA